MKRMLDWLTWLLWTSEIVFLAASTPHIATYFEHFDNPTDAWSTAYAWAVGYGLALTIDGVTFVILMSLVVAIKYRRPWWLTSFLVFSLLLISSLSWFINWQYDIVFRSTTFARADQIPVHLWFTTTSVGSLNPLIGGAFPLLSVLYALVAKALEVDEGTLTKTAMTTEQFENEKQRLIQERELKSLKASQWDGKGLLTSAKERLIGVQVTSQLEDNNEPVTDPSIENVSPIEEYPMEDIETLKNNDTLPDSLASGPNVSLEYACELLECDMRTVKQLLSKGKVKSPGTSKKWITRASIDGYLATKRKRKSQSQGVQLPITRYSDENVLLLEDNYSANSNGHHQETEELSLPYLSVVGDK